MISVHPSQSEPVEHTVVQFPTRVRDWAAVERKLRPGLRDIGISPAVEERIVGVMRAFYASVDIDFDFALDADIPRDVAAAIGVEISAAFNDRLHAFRSRLCIERLDRELDACREMGIW